MNETISVKAITRQSGRRSINKLKSIGGLKAATRSIIQSAINQPNDPAGEQTAPRFR